MILLVGGQKGGSGKSSLAVAIAAERARSGKNVLLVDANAFQGTASNWAARREDTDFAYINCVEKSGNIHKSIKELSTKYDEIIVDTGGQDSKELRTALIAADVLLTPSKPSQADLETLVYVSELVDKAQEMNPDLQAKVVLTQSPSHPAMTLVQESREVLNGATEVQNLEVLNTVIYSRKAYMDMIAQGCGVTEMKDKKAKAEIENLIKEIF